MLIREFVSKGNSNYGLVMAVIFFIVFVLRMHKYEIDDSNTDTGIYIDVCYLLQIQK